MPTPEGVWAEYSIGTLIDDSIPQTARIERVFSSELNALRSATTNGNRAVLVRFGETIEEALTRAAGGGGIAAAEFATVPNPKRRTVTQRAAERVAAEKLADLDPKADA